MLMAPAVVLYILKPLTHPRRPSLLSLPSRCLVCLTWQLLTGRAARLRLGLTVLLAATPSARVHTRHQLRNSTTTERKVQP
jgi:hypothetical protein